MTDALNIAEQIADSLRCLERAVEHDTGDLGWVTFYASEHVDTLEWAATQGYYVPSADLQGALLIKSLISDKHLPAMPGAFGFYNY